MSNWLDKIRSSPIEHRRRLVYIVVIVAVVVLLLLWLVLGNPATPQSNKQSSEFIEELNQTIRNTQENIINPLE